MREAVNVKKYEMNGNFHSVPWFRPHPPLNRKNVNDLDASPWNGNFHLLHIFLLDVFPTVTTDSIADFPPDGPVISVARTQFQVGETAGLVCTVQTSSPPSHLSWFINDEPVSEVLPHLAFCSIFNDSVHLHKGSKIKVTWPKVGKCFMKYDKLITWPSPVNLRPCN